MPKYKEFLEKKSTDKLLAEDYDDIYEYFKKLFSKVLIGELRYGQYVYYANKVVENPNSLEFFSKARKKPEILEHLRKL